MQKSDRISRLEAGFQHIPLVQNFKNIVLKIGGEKPKKIFLDKFE